MSNTLSVQPEGEFLAELQGRCLGTTPFGRHSWLLIPALKTSTLSPHPQATLILGPGTCLVTHSM